MPRRMDTFRINIEVQDWMTRLGLDFWNNV